MYLKFVFVFFCLSFLIETNAFAQSIKSESNINKGFALLELFTSEGCNSCPPAETNLKNILETNKAKNLPVFVLTYHVDYWNRLGWIDPYSHASYTQRQISYEKALQKGGLYTPQLVVNGTWEGPGSNKGIVEKLVDRALSQNFLRFGILNKNNFALEGIAIGPKKNNFIRRSRIKYKLIASGFSRIFVFVGQIYGAIKLS